ncbi:hypothetical protein [Vibrio sp. Y159]|uniref:hypothetical protein n=1 Tax=Vibrio sp. Y159 TaxID=3074703 RepID=UPI0029644193|nr:hypothetical protein [Vibrio sp. Y159]MDW1533310.1 hypothetical protein [Vibrio sp. Y159]
MEKVTIKLDSNNEQRRFLSHVANELPTSNGIHLIRAHMGVGKTFFQSHASDTHGDLVIFSMKSIKRQQEFDASNAGHNLITEQLEHFVEKDLEELKRTYSRIHVDEVHLIYDAGYRAETIDGLYKKIVELSKFMPVYCYSGTFKMNLSPFDFDTVVEIEKQVPKKELRVFMPEASREEGSYNGISARMLADIIQEDLDKPVLFFNNNHKTNTNIAEYLRKNGVTCEVVNSASVKDKNSKFSELANTSMIASMDVQVVLTTCALEEGININDAVRIVCVQDAPEKISQQFGRCRNPELGSFDLVVGQGENALTDEYVNSIVADCHGEEFNSAVIRERWGIPQVTNLITNERHREAVYKRCIEITLCKKTGYGMHVLDEVKRVGNFEISDIFEAPKGESLRQVGITKAILLDVFREYHENIGKFIEKYENIVKEIKRRAKCLRVHAEVAVSKMDAFIERWDLLNLNIGWDTAYQHLTKSTLLWIECMTKQELIDLASHVKKYANALKKAFDNGVVLTKEQFIDSSRSFLDEFITAREHMSEIANETDASILRMFKMLTNAKEINETMSFSDKQWWDDVLGDAKSRKTYSRHKSFIEETISIDEFHEKTQLTRSETAQMKKKDIKAKLAEVTW